METVLITLIGTIGAVICVVYLSRTAQTYKKNNAEDITKKYVAARQKASYWKGKYDAIAEEELTEEELEGLPTAGLLENLDMGTLEKIPVIGKYLAIPKYRKMAEEILKGAQEKKATGGGEETDTGEFLK